MSSQTQVRPRLRSSRQVGDAVPIAALAGFLGPGLARGAAMGSEGLVSAKHAGVEDGAPWRGTLVAGFEPGPEGVPGETLDEGVASVGGQLEARRSQVFPAGELRPVNRPTFSAVLIPASGPSRSGAVPESAVLVVPPTFHLGGVWRFRCEAPGLSLMRHRSEHAGVSSGSETRSRRSKR